MKTLEMLSEVYGESTMARSKVYEWYRRFKEGRESIGDNERVGRPSTSQNVENVALVMASVDFLHHENPSTWAVSNPQHWVQKASDKPTTPPSRSLEEEENSLA
ncbi:hypothetical protein TNCV_1523421 [Trichonephila clavipes]|nr:hypothetical protein TNCV_1523421 [Trichonephila clavipes]